jgi:predicted transposase YbfD/YdcC
MPCIVKKTLNLIIERGNNFLVKIKGNQPKLLKSVKNIVETTNAISTAIDNEKNRGKIKKRKTDVYLPTSEIPDGWSSLKRIIHVERDFKDKSGSHNTHSYYISSVESNDASEFAIGIRGHWSIENKLHWVKDVIQKEDSTRHKKGFAAINMSIMRNIAINIFRNNGYDSVKHATLFFASNIGLLIKILFRT